MSSEATRSEFVVGVDASVASDAGGIDDLHLGSVSSGVARSGRVPVIVVRGGD